MKKLVTVILPIAIGLGLLGLAIWLFFLAKEDNAYILLFGLGTAVLIPVSLSLIGFGFNFRNRKVNEKLSELSKISDIQTLLDHAKTTEEQLEILKTEYQNLEKSLRFNSEKISLELRRDDIIKKSKEIITELDEINNELELLKDNLSDFEIPVEVELLRERVFKKQVAVIRFRNKTYSYNRIGYDINLWGISFRDVIYDVFKTIEKSQKLKLKREIEQIEQNDN